MKFMSGIDVFSIRRPALSAAAIAAAVIAAGLVFAVPALADDPGCTISGTSRADVLKGTPGNDVICGLGGNDVILGAGGNDVLNGGDGNDRISGDAGNDNVIGGGGNDILNGGVGTDTVRGDAGNDSIGGDPGNDVLNGGAGSDQLAGGAGNDALQGGAGLDRLDPGTGADTCAPDASDRVSGSCSIDRDGPVAAWVDLPSTVTAGTTLAATFSLRDRSSVNPGSPNLTIGGAPGWITSWCGFPIMASLASGTLADGIWSVSCAVPITAVTDPYSLWVNAQDSFGNPGRLNADFAVVGGASDNQAPAITDVAIPAKANPGETITIRWRAADPSGVKDTPYPWVYRPAPQFGVIHGSGVEAPVLTSGTALDGTWSQTITLPADSVNGSYAVYISVRDELGNKTFEQYGSFTVGTAAPQAAGSPDRR